jgi:hypothetical protein
MAVGYDKAYKLLAIQEKISNAKAKDILNQAFLLPMPLPDQVKLTHQL